jgi:hypothetical protein
MPEAPEPNIVLVIIRFLAMGAIIFFGGNETKNT